MNHLDQWQSPDVHAVRAGVAAPAPASCSCKRKAYAVAGVEAQGSAGKPRNVKGKIEGEKKKIWNTTSFFATWPYDRNRRFKIPPRRASYAFHQINLIALQTGLIYQMILYPELHVSLIYQRLL